MATQTHFRIQFQGATTTVKITDDALHVDQGFVRDVLGNTVFGTDRHEWTPLSQVWREVGTVLELKQQECAHKKIVALLEAAALENDMHNSAKSAVTKQTVELLIESLKQLHAVKQCFSNTAPIQSRALTVLAAKPTRKRKRNSVGGQADAQGKRKKDCLS